MTGQPFELDLPQLLAEEDFVRRLARGLLFDEHRVDDVVQQTWIAALRNPPQHPGALRAWLSGVVRRTAANEVRGKVRRERRERAVASSESNQPSVDEVLAREERRREVVDALAALTEPYRTVVALRYLEGLEPIVIAERVGAPGATVRTWLRRGLDRMRESLDARHGGDRGAWCVALLPLVRGRDAVTTGMAMTLVTTGAITVQKILFAVAMLIAATLAFVSLRPEPASSTPARSLTEVSTSGQVAAAPAGTAGRPEAPEVVVERGSRSPMQAVVLANRSGLHGRLLAPDGAPLAAATVECIGLDGPDLFRGVGSPVGERAVTDEGGWFTIAAVAARARCVLIADVNGPLRQIVPIATNPDPGHVAELGEIRLDDRGAITGTVVDPDGEPVAGADVWAADVPALALAAFPIDRLAPRHGALVMIPRPTADGCGGDGVDYAMRVRQHLAFRLVRDAMASATDEAFVPVVVDASVLEPLWNALPIARAVSAMDGTFRIDGVAAGANLVVAHRSGFVNAVRGSVRIVDGTARSAGTLRLGAGREARGVVVDATGATVEGAEVRVAVLGIAGFRGIAPCEPLVRTGTDGEFRVPDLPRASICIAARRDATAPWVAIGPVDVDADHRIALPTEQAVAFEVRGPGGGALEGFRVFARPTPPLGELASAGLVAAEVERNVERIPGSKSPTLTLAHGVWTVRVVADGCAPCVRTVLVPFDGRLEFELKAAREFDVQVLNAEGRPCAASEVLVFDAEDVATHPVLMTSFGLPRWERGLPQSSVQTDERGHAIVRAPVEGSQIVARHPSGGIASIAVDTSTASSVVLRLPDTGSIVGHFGLAVDSANRPLRVSATRLGELGSDRAPHAGVTTAVDAAGDFRIDGLTAGHYLVEVRRALPTSFTINGLMSFVQEVASPFGDDGELTSARVEVPAGAVVPVAFEPAGDVATGRVVGTVFVDGAPARGLSVWVRRRTRKGQMTSDAGWEGQPRTTIDATGHFEIDGLPARTVWIGVRDGEAGDFVHAFEVDVRAGETVELNASVRFGRVIGVLRDAAGRPVGGIEVMLAEGSDGSHDVVLRTTTGVDGEFTFARAPVGPARLMVSSDLVAVDSVPLDVLAASATPAVTMTAQMVHRLALRISDPHPSTTDPIRVHLHDSNGSTWIFVPVDGVVSTSFRRPGRYEITLQCNGHDHVAIPSTVELIGLETVIDVQVGPQLERPK